MCRTVVVVAIVSVIMWWLWFVVVAITVVYVVRRIGFVAGALAMADFAFVVWSLRIGFFLIVDAVAIVVSAWLFALLAISRIVVTAMCLFGRATVAATTAILSLDCGDGQDSANKCDGQCSKKSSHG
jgi:hypothetical protein